jgi:transcriptional regulator with XRE-family HTH domain
MRLQSGATLQALIEQRGLNQSRLAEAAGCSRSFISGLCSGQRKSCTDELASRIAEVVQVPVDVLFAPNESPIRGYSVSKVGVVA